MKKSILCVDDEKNILNSLKRLFQEKNISCFTAENAKQGLEILEKNDINVIIADQKMPGMNGIEFLQIVKNSYPHVFRLMLTAYDDFEFLVDSIYKDEVYSFLTKPWKNDHLLKIVIQACLLQEVKILIENICKKLRSTIESNITINFYFYYSNNNILLVLSKKNENSKNILKFFHRLIDEMIKENSSIQFSYENITFKKDHMILETSFTYESSEHDIHLKLEFYN